ncbi:M48 family metallopeptidase [Simiduia aestuariiviva]|uniref:Zn-dependent protease with chaperone function n=1 Tax=Simiduia aestuariiviva TaxID=1510459 RepID=A0A839UN25_9GAMM|nr:M48 family metallopeptidase [Simiduia aestuariiviva]MBB3169123.1 Zn-dependent protease with chaperone function [Simiduia aestuariiviva]
MNFFEHQDQARAQTKRLVFLFGLAVIALIAITSLFTALLIHYTQGAAVPSPEQGYYWHNFFSLLDWHLVLMVSIAVLVLVGLGSLYKLSQLSQGGDAVAQSLNGRLLNVSMCDVKEKRLLNVVEEMAIAAGVPVPPVYLLDEPGINAFAAGYHPKDAVIGVTRGCIEQLSRDELQGVIAHEYSHILHGDMRLNLRLVGVLHGILLIGLVGEILMRSGRRSRKNGGGILLFGLGLLIIGYAGTFFGNLIKSAVSRQREFLADASAVQFTRNPTGISGALKRIGGFPAGSQLEVANAAEYSHFYFANGVTNWLGGMMATHPPLAERIKRIDPRWQGELTPPNAGADDGRDTETTSTQPNQAAAAFAAAGAVAGVAINADSIIAEMGNPAPEALAQAHTTLAQLPASILDATHNTASAMALIYGLLFTEKVADEQRKLLADYAPASVAKLYHQLLPELVGLPVNHRMPIIELCLPALKSLSGEQLKQFQRNLIALIKADQHLSLGEWCVYRMLQHNLFPPKYRSSPAVTLASCAEACRSLLCLMARQGDLAQQQTAYERGLTALDLPHAPLLPEPDSYPVIDRHLAQLRRLKPLQKPQLLKALMLTLQTDGKVQPAEYELLRVIADSLDCPMPILH